MNGSEEVPSVRDDSDDGVGAHRVVAHRDGVEMCRPEEWRRRRLIREKNEGLRKVQTNFPKANETG